MKLLLKFNLLIKFNLVFLLIFAIGMIAFGQVSWNLLEKNARSEIREKARLVMDAALATREYTSLQVGPLLDTQMKYTFLPQSVPTYAATEVFKGLRKSHADFSYKESVLNPTNPRNRALEWEADLIARFRNSKDSGEVAGDHATPDGVQFYIARPIRIYAAACLRCHSTVDAAPRTMVERYGPDNGFGWTLNEVVGAQIVSVPVNLPLERAEQAHTAFMISIAVAFLVIGVALNAMLWTAIIGPLAKLAEVADRVSQGELDVPDFQSKASDEIGVLTRSLGRMRAELLEARKTAGN